MYGDAQNLNRILIYCRMTAGSWINSKNKSFSIFVQSIPQIVRTISKEQFHSYFISLARQTYIMLLKITNTMYIYSDPFIVLKK